MKFDRYKMHSRCTDRFFDLDLFLIKIISKLFFYCNCNFLQQKGYPDSLCREIAYKQMNTDYTATRMLGYLYRISDPRPEDVVDEMLAILSDRNAIIQKKELEHAQATINKVYREGL